jgi:hypothetical protein
MMSMGLARGDGFYIVFEHGVMFPMVEFGCRFKVFCFHSRVGFAKLLNKPHLSQSEMRDIFRENRQVIERLADTLFGMPVQGEQ